MTNLKDSLFTAAIEFQEILKTIEELSSLGEEDNGNYFTYCNNKSKIYEKYESVLEELYNDAYNQDVNKRRGINVFILNNIVENYFKALDDIDTASDMYKPVYTLNVKCIEYLHRLRWLYCYTNSNEVNSECFDKRIELIF